MKTQPKTRAEKFWSRYATFDEGSQKIFAELEKQHGLNQDAVIRRAVIVFLRDDPQLEKPIFEGAAKIVDSRIFNLAIRRYKAWLLSHEGEPFAAIDQLLKPQAASRAKKIKPPCNATLDNYEHD